MKKIWESEFIEVFTLPEPHFLKGIHDKRESTEN